MARRKLLSSPPPALSPHVLNGVRRVQILPPSLCCSFSNNSFRSGGGGGDGGGRGGGGRGGGGRGGGGRGGNNERRGGGGGGRGGGGRGSGGGVGDARRPTLSTPPSSSSPSSLQQILNKQQPQQQQQQQQQSSFFKGGSSSSSSSSSNNKKESFDKKILKPAFQGELAHKHSSGIPRLAARKHKARLAPDVKPSISAMEKEDENESDDERLLAEGAFAEEQGAATTLASSLSKRKIKMFEPMPSSLQATRKQQQQGKRGTLPLFRRGAGGYYDLNLLKEDEKEFYWAEEDYDELWPEGMVVDPSDEFNENGEVVIPFDPQDFVTGGPASEFDFSYSRVFASDDGEDEEDDFYDDDNDNDDLAGVASDDEMDKAHVASFQPRGARAGFSSSGGADRSKAWNYQDPEESFFYNQNDIMYLASLPREQFDNQVPEPNIVLPLRPHGPELDDFLEAMMEHPTKFASVESIRPHVDSCREPKPYLPFKKMKQERMNPPEEFVKAHERFLYVTGLPPLEVDGEPGDLDNPIHRNFLQKTVAHLLDEEGAFDTSRIFPANLSSAFVGFPSPLALAEALAYGPAAAAVAEQATTLSFSPPAFSLWKGEVPKQLQGSKQGDSSSSLVVDADGAAIVQLANVPVDFTAGMLRRALFPKGSELETVYGKDITLDSFYLQSSLSTKSNSVWLIRFQSREQAESAVQSVLLQRQLENHIGQNWYVPRFFRARRELLHAGYQGPNRSEEKRVKGPRLIVDGDMPSKQFFLSHARVVHVRNLDNITGDVTAEQLSAAFDPYCARRRDVVGSIEFVTCRAGLPTGCAYVGFDTPGEAEAAVRDLNGSLVLPGSATRATLRLVHDRQIPGQRYTGPAKRGERTIEELLDDLNNWERYVDPADVKLLEAHGISKIVLDEALRNIRYKNKTFGSFDSAIRSEALEPEKESGELYKELVQLYIATLKDCLATPDNVGFMYEATHFPDEPIDLSVFEREKSRQKKLMEKRANP